MKTSIVYCFFPLFIVGLFFFYSCNKKQEFTIEGKIQDAGNEILYLEHVGISKTTLLDSIILDATGNYRFHQARPAYPDFYRLRLNNQRINLAVDSVETITVNAPAAFFATHYTLDEKNTENLKIKELTLLQIKSSKEFNALSGQFENGEITAERYEKDAYRIIREHKEKVKEIIGSGFQNLSAYFALFQQINNFLIFDPYNKEDHKLYGALANTWDLYYPNSPRTLQLKNLYLSARATPQNPVSPVIIESIDGKTLFDISFPSPEGKEIRMSEACAGKVTLIDFTAYSAEGSPEHNMMLSEIYHNKRYKDMAIYQISLDEDEHAWKNAAINLPWICVRDPQPAQSEIIRKYNVTTLPTTFIMNKNGEVVFRVENYDDLEKEIANYLN